MIQLLLQKIVFKKNFPSQIKNEKPFITLNEVKRFLLLHCVSLPNRKTVSVKETILALPHIFIATSKDKTLIEINFSGGHRGVLRDWLRHTHT